MEDEVGRIAACAVGGGNGESMGVASAFLHPPPRPPEWTFPKGDRKKLSGSQRELGGGSEELGLVPPPQSQLLNPSMQGLPVHSRLHPSGTLAPHHPLLV